MNEERRQERLARMAKAEETNDITLIEDYSALLRQPDQRVVTDWRMGLDMSEGAQEERRKRRRLEGWLHIGLWFLVSGTAVAVAYAIGVI